MSQESSDRLVEGDWDAEDWTRNDPHSQATTAADWGEDWTAYDQAHERVQEEAKQRERWALDTGGQ